MRVRIKDLKPGDLFTLKPVPEDTTNDNLRVPKESQVYIRKEYDRSERKYWCQKWSDISDGKCLSGDREVYTDFVF